MSRGRALGVTLVALLLTGCAGTEDPTGWDERLAEDAGTVEEVYADVVPQVMAASGTSDFGTAGLVHALCGDRSGFDMAKTGIGVEINANLGAAINPPAEAADLLRTQLVDDDWTLAEETGSKTVEATRDGVTVRVVLGTAATQVDVAADCVETSVDYARDASGLAPEELEEPMGE